MTLTLYYHPFSSFCQKVLVALYEREVPFEGVIVDFSDPEQKAAFERLWPIGKFPVLRDEERGATVPESSLIVEYLDRVHPGPPLIPAESGPALKVRHWDRFFDHYVELPLQKVVGDTFRPEGGHDPHGVEEARAMLSRAYDLLEDSLGEAKAPWAAGDSFSLADCGAAPALFYAAMVVPFDGRRNVEAYYDRLRARPSFARAVEEARSYRPFFPLPWPEGWD